MSEAQEIGNDSTISGLSGQEHQVLQVLLKKAGMNAKQIIRVQTRAQRSQFHLGTFGKNKVAKALQRHDTVVVRRVGKCRVRAWGLDTYLNLRQRASHARQRGVNAPVTPSVPTTPSDHDSDRGSAGTDTRKRNRENPMAQRFAAHIKGLRVSKQLGEPADLSSRLGYKRRDNGMPWWAWENAYQLPNITCVSKMGEVLQLTPQEAAHLLRLHADVLKSRIAHLA